MEKLENSTKEENKENVSDSLFKEEIIINDENNSNSKNDNEKEQ